MRLLLIENDLLINTIESKMIIQIALKGINKK